MFSIIRPVFDDLGRAIGWWGLYRPEEKCSQEEYLTHRERLEYARLNSDDRKREWLAARMALKRIVMQSKRVQSPLHCQIEKDRMGCPTVRLTNGNEFKVVNCSISHKKGLAAVFISWLPEVRIGIDIEAISEKPRGLRSAFVGEEDSLGDMSKSRQYYTVLWACKEAASKVLGLGMLADLKGLNIIGDSDGRFSVSEDGRKTIRGDFSVHGGFVVAKCYRNDNSLNGGLEVKGHIGFCAPEC